MKGFLYLHASGSEKLVFNHFSIKKITSGRLPGSLSRLWLRKAYFLIYFQLNISSGRLPGSLNRLWLREACFLINCQLKYQCRNVLALSDADFAKHQCRNVVTLSDADFAKHQCRNEPAFSEAYFAKIILLIRLLVC